jgi:hypothetical protein
MPEESKNHMQCGEFEALLSDVLDQQLTGAKLQGFQAHARACAVCGPLLTEAEAGKHWLKSLADVDPPAHLVHNILASTIGVETTRLGAAARGRHEPSFLDRVQDWASSLGGRVFATVARPRFAMSFGMAFFSITFAMSVAGVKLSDLKQVDLRPSALQRTYYTTTGKVVKYYENIRFVYEIESRVRELKRATTPAEPGPPKKKDENRKNNDTSGQPEKRQEQNYSRGENQPVLAFAPQDPTVVLGATYRRVV